MTEFKPAINESAFLKAGFWGFQGSGKTYTAVEVAIGLHKYAKSDKPIAFIDTETGSDWAIPKFKSAGIELDVAKTRAFKDLIDLTKAAEEKYFCLLIDSATHFWNEMIESYRMMHGLGARMAFHHWSVLKPEWARFTNLYVNSKIHCIVCGRAGWEWGHEEDDEGNKELMKMGTKMKVEGEFGFEPNLLIEMQRVKGKEIGSKMKHVAYVIKDRRQDDKSMDGLSFINPKFDDFLPHIQCLNLGGKHLGFDETKNSNELFKKEGESYSSIKKRRDILIEEINGILEANFPGSGKEEKHAKLALKKHLLGTYSDTAIAELNPRFLKSAVAGLTQIVGSKDRDDLVREILKKLTHKEDPKKEMTK
jgi:hypothetical protein